MGLDNRLVLPEEFSTERLPLMRPFSFNLMTQNIFIYFSCISDRRIFSHQNSDLGAFAPFFYT